MIARPDPKLPKEDVWRTNRTRLRNFKRDLRTRRFELFSDIEDFSKVLQNTLSRKIKNDLELQKSIDKLPQDSEAAKLRQKLEEKAFAEQQYKTKVAEAYNVFISLLPSTLLSGT